MTRTIAGGTIAWAAEAAVDVGPHSIGDDDLWSPFAEAVDGVTTILIQDSR